MTGMAIDVVDVSWRFPEVAKPRTSRAARLFFRSNTRRAHGDRCYRRDEHSTPRIVALERCTSHEVDQLDDAADEDAFHLFDEQDPEGFDLEAHRQHQASQARKSLRKAVKRHERRIRRADLRELEEHPRDERADQIRRFRTKIAWIRIRFSRAETREQKEYLEGCLLQAELDLIDFEVRTQYAPRRHAA